MPLPMRTATPLLARMLPARRSISASSASSGTTRLTSPLALASMASMKSPVSSISSAALRPRLRARPTAGVEQKRPTLMPETANFEISAATARSHIDTSWQPAAVTAHFLQIVAGTEGLAGAGDHDDANCFAGGDGIQFGLQGRQHVLGQRV